MKLVLVRSRLPAIMSPAKLETVEGHEGVPDKPTVANFFQIQQVSNGVKTVFDLGLNNRLV
jgi:hypothetical protein